MKTFLKYALVGAGGTLIDVGLFALLMRTSLGASYTGVVFAASVSFLLAVGHNFIWNRQWTFRDHSGVVAEQFAKFFIVSCGGWILNIFMLTVFMSHFFSPVLAKVAASGLVLSYNFIANRFWTFSPNASA